MNGAVVLEYSSVYAVHTAIDPTRPLRSRPGSFFTGTILSALRQVVDPTKYDFVLIYSLEEVPGWINSGDVGTPTPAKNIGLYNPN